MLAPASMPPTAGQSPAVSSPCRACGKRLPAGKSVCPACGAAHGEQHRCPHCSAIADVEADAALGFVCRVCGGPRLALDGAFTAPAATTQRELVLAKQQHRRHQLLSGAGVLLGAAGAVGLLVALLVMLAGSPGLLLSLLSFALPGAAGLAALAALSGAARARGARQAALHAAQLGALADVQAAQGALDATRAAEILRVTPDQAEMLLAEASVNAMLQPMPEARLRVETADAPLNEVDGELSPSTQRQRGETELGD